MADFIAKGRTLRTTDGIPFTVTAQSEAADSYQLYRVSLNGEDKIFTRLIGCSDEKKAFYEALGAEKLATAETNWPVAFCNNAQENIFGFISNTIPKDYKLLSDLLYERTNQFGLKNEIDICLNLATLFGKLCEKGYYISNLTEANVAFNPLNGAIFLNAFKNITNDKEIYSVNSIKFSPPEYYHQKSKGIIPESARYILSVIMFIVFFRAHPLDGIRASSKAYLTKDDLYSLYLKYPVFMLDPEDDSNRPSEYIYSKLQEKWDSFPSFIRDLFIESFSKKAIKEPLSRPDEIKWINALVKMRSFSFVCSCTAILSLSEEGKGSCPCCKKAFEVACKIKLKNYTIPTVNKTRVYRCQVTDNYTISNATEPVGVIVANPSNPQLLGFKNMTNEALVCTTIDGNTKTINNGEIAPLINGISVNIYETTIHFINSLSVPAQPIQKATVEPEQITTIPEETVIFDPEAPAETSGGSQSEEAVQTLSENPLFSYRENSTDNLGVKAFKTENIADFKEKPESSYEKAQAITEEESQEAPTEEADAVGSDDE